MRAINIAEEVVTMMLSYFTVVLSNSPSLDVQPLLLPSSLSGILGTVNWVDIRMQGTLSPSPFIAGFKAAGAVPAGLQVKVTVDCIHWKLGGGLNQT